MKIKVVTNSEGKIVATARCPSKKAGEPEVSMVPRPGEQIQEIDLPSQLEDVSAEELHKELQSRLKK